MKHDIETIWRTFSKKHLTREDSTLRKSTIYKNAEPWLNGVEAPTMPATMLSNVTVFESWLNTHNLNLAKELLSQQSGLTLRELLVEMLLQINAGHAEYPYIWWVWPHSSKVRAIHEDSNGLTFVKLEKKWKMAYSIQAMGALAGAQGTSDYEELPRNAYFVSWENEEIARAHMS